MMEIVSNFWQRSYAINGNRMCTQIHIEYCWMSWESEYHNVMRMSSNISSGYTTNFWGVPGWGHKTKVGTKQGQVQLLSLATFQHIHVSAISAWVNRKHAWDCDYITYTCCYSCTVWSILGLWFSLVWIKCTFSHTHIIIVHTHSHAIKGRDYWLFCSALARESICEQFKGRKNTRKYTGTNMYHNWIETLLVDYHDSQGTVFVIKLHNIIGMHNTVVFQKNQHRYQYIYPLQK